MWPFKKKKMYKITYRPTITFGGTEAYCIMSQGYNPAHAWERFVGPNRYRLTMIDIEEVLE